MSKGVLSFYNYVMNKSGSDIEEFKNVFGERIESMPDKITSSKVLMILLNINDREEYRVFRNVYMEYFREKMFGEIN